jgi:hypothetical protein
VASRCPRAWLDWWSGVDVTTGTITPKCALISDEDEFPDVDGAILMPMA